MHPSTHLRAEVDALKAELAELKARLVPETPTGATDGLPYFVDLFGLKRNKSDGDTWVAHRPTLDETRAAAAAQRLGREAERAAEWAKRTEGCPSGYYRDDTNLMRNIQTGESYGYHERDSQQMAAVAREQARQHREYLRMNALPDGLRGKDDEED